MDATSIQLNPITEPASLQLRTVGNQPSQHVKPPRYFTIAELRLFNSDDSCHDNDFDDFDDFNDFSEDKSQCSIENNTADADEDLLACLDESWGEEGLGEVCELHVYERRYNSRGLRVEVQVGTMEQIDAEIHRNPYAALVLVRSYDMSRQLEDTKLEIRSPWMKRALKDVIGSYPGTVLNSIGIIELRDVPRCLFHNRHKLQEFAEKSDDEDMKEHVDFLLKYMAKALERELGSWKTLMESNEKAPGLRFADLWMAFDPGDLLYVNIACSFGPHVRRFLSMTLVSPKLFDEQNQQYWVIKCEKLDCDGITISSVLETHFLFRYDEYRPLTSLNVYPLRYHDEEARVRGETLARGKHWLSLAGVHHRTYTGVAQLMKFAGNQPGFDLIPVNGRILIDPNEYNMNLQSGRLRFLPGRTWVKCPDLKEGDFVEDQLMTSNCKVMAYSLVAKRWGSFDVQGVKDIDFNHTALEDLVIPSQKKELIRSLVSVHQDWDSGFDDIIKGKGKGTIFLLHGPPGVGKTLTAESIADYTKRPLYILGAGDLGTNNAHVESTLKRSQELATKWNAVVLIDEADVFMEQRNNHDLSRNELVSILLRILEYFEGVMFLTTNRVESIDTAFKSRIHLSLYYPELSQEARSTIWKALIARGSDSSAPTWLDGDLLARFASYNINGRQIKNTIRMACTIAAYEERELKAEDIFKGLEALESFESDFRTPETKTGFHIANLIQSSLRNLRGPGWMGVVWSLTLSVMAVQSVWPRAFAFATWWRVRRR